MVLSRQNTSAISRTKEQINAIENGGYLIKEEDDATLSLIASGSELQLVLDAADVLLNEHGIKTNVISMPCLDVFRTG